MRCFAKTTVYKVTFVYHSKDQTVRLKELPAELQGRIVLKKKSATVKVPTVGPMIVKWMYLWNNQVSSSRAGPRAKPTNQGRRTFVREETENLVVALVGLTERHEKQHRAVVVVLQHYGQELSQS